MMLPLFLWVLCCLPRFISWVHWSLYFKYKFDSILYELQLKKKIQKCLSCGKCKRLRWGSKSAHCIAPSSQILWSFCNLQISTESSVRAATWEQEERKPNYEDTFEERLLYYTAHQKTLKGKATVCHRAAKRWFLKTVQSMCSLLLQTVMHILIRNSILKE